MALAPKNKGFTSFFTNISFSRDITLPTTGLYNQSIIPNIDDFIYHEIYVISKQHYPLDKTTMPIGRPFVDPFEDIILKSILATPKMQNATTLSGASVVDFPYPTEYFVNKSESRLIRVSKSIWGLPSFEACIFITQAALEDTPDNKGLSDFLYNYILSFKSRAVNPHVYIISSDSNQKRLLSKESVTFIDPIHDLVNIKIQALLKNEFARRGVRFTGDLRFFDKQCVIPRQLPTNAFVFIDSDRLNESSQLHITSTHYWKLDAEELCLPQAPMSDGLFQAIIMSVGEALKNKKAHYVKDLEALAPNLILLLNLFAHKRQPLGAKEPFYMCSPKTLQFENQTVFEAFVDKVPYLKAQRDNLRRSDLVSSMQDTELEMAAFCQKILVTFTFLIKSLLNAFSLLSGLTPVYTRLPNIQEALIDTTLGTPIKSDGYRLFFTDENSIFSAPNMLDFVTAYDLEANSVVEGLVFRNLVKKSERYKTVPLADRLEYESFLSSVLEAPVFLIGNTAPNALGLLNRHPISRKLHTSADSSEDKMTNQALLLFESVWIRMRRNRSLGDAFSYSDFLDALNEALSLITINYLSETN
jgi:hypothetical protein